MSPRSRSRSYTSRRSYSRSAERRNNGRRRQRYGTRSRSRSRHAPITPPSPNYHRHAGKYSCDSRSCSRSWTPRYERHYYGARRHGSRSRSRSYSTKHSPIANRNTREKPLPSRCIGVFGLSVHTTQQKIREIFSKYGPIDRIQVVIDAQTGRSRGFCFIYYQNLPDAKAARDNCCGMEIDGRRIRVAYSITERPHTPTPGIYMGRSTNLIRDRYRVRSRRHSPSPYSSRNGRRRHERSRSPSITPPRYSRY